MNFTIYDPVTKAILRKGSVRLDSDIALQPIPAGAVIVSGIYGDLIEDKIDDSGDKPRLVKRDVSDIASRRLKQFVPVDSSDLLVEILKKKGITITDADRVTAEQQLRAARTPGEKG